MNLLTLLILGVTAVLYTTLFPAKWREWALLVGSVIVLYWLQPFNPIRFSGYILPTVTISLVILGWWVTRPKEKETAALRLEKDDRATLLVIAGLVVAISFLRFLPQDLRPIANRPPSPVWAAAGLAVGGVLLGLMIKDLRLKIGLHKPIINIQSLIIIILVLFIILKTEPLATAVAHLWRNLTNQDASLASAADLTWLGFSYVAFRLLHTLRDRQTGLLPTLSLREYATYVLFFPAITAGPIDRAERFVADLHVLPQMADAASVAGLDAARFAGGLTRIGIGLFKKFVIADSLALGMSLDGVDVSLVQSTGHLWLLLYGYAFRLLFDFSGYTDIAIGLGLLFGVQLPENFRRPYRQTSLTAFWQSWHITLSDWARFYVFTPLSRALLRRKPRPSPTLIVLMAQLATMVTIGLWHGVSGNFLIWGLWHGVGLFIHKQWSDRTRKWYRGLAEKPVKKWAWTLISWFLTFHYVVIGWVWFVLPDPALAAQTIVKLFGGG